MVGQQRAGAELDGAVQGGLCRVQGDEYRHRGRGGVAGEQPDAVPRFGPLRRERVREGRHRIRQRPAVRDRLDEVGDGGARERGAVGGERCNVRVGAHSATSSATWLRKTSTLRYPAARSASRASGRPLATSEGACASEPIVQRIPAARAMRRNSVEG